jgi:Mce-associated membrane protein
VTVTDADTPPTPPTPNTPTLISASGPRPAGRPGAPWWVVAVLAVALIGALVAAGLLWKAESDKAGLIDAGKDARTAAEHAAVQMTTYNWKTVDQDFGWVDSAGTDHFKETYSRVSKPAMEIVKTLKATAQGTVMGSGVDVQDATHVNVALFVDQSITGQGAGTSEPDRSRLLMHMVEQDGRWLVDGVELIGPANNR